LTSDRITHTLQQPAMVGDDPMMGAKQFMEIYSNVVID
jgi:hypothetical protein